MTSRNSRRTSLVAAVIILLVIMEAAMLLSVRQESQTSDEAYSLLAGYLHLTRGDFSICPGYPPLTKEVAAAPLLFFRPNVPAMTAAEISDFRGGRVFLYANRAGALLFAARAAMTVFPVLLALIVFLAAQEMFGTGPGLVAMVLVAFEPNILAHGPLVTNDVALSCWLFAAVYAFWRFMNKPSGWRLAATGIAAGLALASKHTAVILFPILLVLGLAELSWPVNAQKTSEIPPQNRGKARTAIRWALALLAVCAISIVVLWGFYAFRYPANPTAEPGVLDSGLGAVHHPIAAATIAALAKFHLLPEAFLQGFTFFSATASRPMYLLGKLYPHGVWFYFPAAFLIKSTLGFLGLLALAAWGLISARERRLEILWMLIPAVLFFGMSMTSSLNIGLRHILPVYPFLTVIAAAGAWKLAQMHRRWRVAVTALVLLHAVSSVRASPDYLAYSNELVGGPSQTYRVLTDSNVDWGQGLPAVRQYIAKNAATPCWFAYFGTVDPAYFDIPCALLTSSSAVVWERPLGETPPVITGTVLVSATEMSGQAWGPGELNPYEQFRKMQPVACLAGSILVYRGSFQVPLASALSRLWKAVALANEGKFEAAIGEAQAAEALAPPSIDVQFVLGRVLNAAGRKDEARKAFAAALRLAQTVYPEWQAYWIPIIAKEMDKL